MRTTLGILLVVALLMGGVGVVWAGPGRDISTARGAYQGHWRGHLTQAEKEEGIDPECYISPTMANGSLRYKIPAAGERTYQEDGWFTILAETADGSIAHRLVVFQNDEKTKRVECVAMGAAGYGCLGLDYIGPETERPTAKPAP